MQSWRVSWSCTDRSTVQSGLQLLLWSAGVVEWRACSASLPANYTPGSLPDGKPWHTSAFTTHANHRRGRHSHPPQPPARDRRAARPFRPRVRYEGVLGGA